MIRESLVIKKALEVSLEFLFLVLNLELCTVSSLWNFTASTKLGTVHCLCCLEF